LITFGIQEAIKWLTINENIKQLKFNCSLKYSKICYNIDSSVNNVIINK